MAIAPQSQAAIAAVNLAREYPALTAHDIVDGINDVLNEARAAGWTSISAEEIASSARPGLDYVAANGTVLENLANPEHSLPRVVLPA